MTMPEGVVKVYEGTCPACGAEARLEVGAPLADERWDNPHVLVQRLPCAWCGADMDYFELERKEVDHGRAE